MSDLRVTITADFTPFIEAMTRVTRAINRMGWAMTRHLSTPGGRHIDRIVRDCLDRRLSVEQTTIRLIAAADLAEVLDGKRGAA